MRELFKKKNSSSFILRIFELYYSLINIFKKLHEVKILFEGTSRTRRPIIEKIFRLKKETIEWQIFANDEVQKIVKNETFLSNDVLSLMNE